MNVTLPITEAAVRPNFLSMVQAELFKLIRQRVVWVMGIVVVALLVIEGLVTTFTLVAIKDIGQSGPQGPDSIIQIPQGFVAHYLMETLLADVRGIIGIFLIVVMVSAIATEYKQGTIRILLARGVGRLRLLGSKMSAVVILGLGMLVIMLVIAYLLGVVDLNLAFGNTNELRNLPSYFTSDTAAYILTVLISMGATILLAAFFAVLGSTLAFGLSFGLLWFFVESIINGILAVITLASGNTAWNQIPNYFFGTKLTALPSALIPSRGIDIAAFLSRGTQALNTSLDATHTLLVTLVYSAIFLGGVGYLIWKRDVLQ